MTRDPHRPHATRTRDPVRSHPGRVDHRRRGEDHGSGGGEIEDLLGGLDFPATRRDLLRHAQDMGAHDVVIRALRDLPERSYRSPADLLREIGNFM
jgi:hypothetical protein